MRKIIFFLLFLAQTPAWAGREAIKLLPIQNGGRVKPFDTFAQESLQLLHGKRTLGERPATDIILTLYMVPELWNDKRFISVKNIELKRDLKLEEMENFFSPNELVNSTRLRLVIEKLRSKEAMKEKLNPYYQSIQKLEGQIYLYRAIIGGQAFTLVPPKSGEGTQWLSVFNSAKEFTDLFADMASEFVQSVSHEIKNKDTAATSNERKVTSDKSNVEEKVKAFMAAAKQQNPELYPSERDMKVEVTYNDLHPFKWSWIFYLLAAIFFLFYVMGAKVRPWLYKSGWGLLLAGFFMHCLGFGLRIYITGRPPVSNMYESVIWVSFGTILFSMIIGTVYRQAAVLFGGSLIAVFCLILADLAPTILDPSLQPLEPVLVSNFWLIIHVMTISISYSAFFLALGLGNIGLFHFIRGEDKNKQVIANITNAIYRSIQIGVVLLAAGIILGGIWADYSWGRFWGWDPKETWALIALLGYLAVLHGRIGGWLRNFGMNAFAVIGFSLVIMAWYGVNYVLGAGLHSYGFGAGGIEWVLGFVTLQFLYVTYAVMVRRKAFAVAS